MISMQDQAGGGNTVLQTTGQNTSAVMSQKAVTDKLALKLEAGDITGKADLVALETKADLIGGTIPAAQLPSYVDDVLVVQFWTDDISQSSPLDGDLWYSPTANEMYVWLESELDWFVITIETGKIYVYETLTYRWSGSGFIQINQMPEFATQAQAEAGAIDFRMMSPLRVLQSFVYNIVNKVFPGLNTTSKTVQGAINELLAEHFNQAPRTVALPAFDIDMKAGEDFTKLTGMATPSTFTISNPIIKKCFRLIMTGGTLAVPTFTGYTVNWILTSLVTDYVPANTNYLVCEIRSAGQIYCFWGA